MIQTPRLIMRKFQIEDAQSVLDFSTDVEVTKYTGDAGMIATLEQAQKLIQEQWYKQYEEIGYARLALIEKKSQRIIGFSGFKYLEEYQLPEMGYRMLPQYWGKGYATESVKALMDHGRDFHRFKKVMAITDLRNKPSENVLIKTGFEIIKQEVVYGELSNIYHYDY